MYEIRSDCKIQVPYGSTVILGCSYPTTTETDEDLSKYINIYSQVRNCFGIYLADFKVYSKGKSEAVIYCDHLLPVGLHFIDIRFEFNFDKTMMKEPKIPITSISEVIGLEVTESVTRMMHESSDGLHGLGGMKLGQHQY